MKVLPAIAIFMMPTEDLLIDFVSWGRFHSQNLTRWHGRCRFFFIKSGKAGCMSHMYQVQHIPENSNEMLKNWGLVSTRKRAQKTWIFFRKANLGRSHKKSVYTPRSLKDLVRKPGLKNGQIEKSLTVIPFKPAITHTHTHPCVFMICRIPVA